MTDYRPDDAGDSGWGTTFHRHVFSNEIHRDIDPCKSLGRKIQVYIFDPENLTEHTRNAQERAWDEGHEDGAWNTHNALAIERLIKPKITNPYRSQP